ncbi:MAG: ATP-binding protein [Alteromonadaceae bacterium]|nr:ATP-binding protein [Alteromonadaceae bacterium]
MFKSFAGLWLLVFGPLFFLLYPSQYNPIVRFNEHIEGQRFTHIYQGTFALIEAQLESVSYPQWQNTVDKLNQKFGFEVKLLDLTSPFITDKQLASLEQGGLVFVNAEPEFLLKKIPQSHYVLQLYTDFSAEEKIKQGAKGSVYLLQQAFENTPSQNWSSLIEQLSESFSFKMQLLEPDVIQLSKQEQLQLDHDTYFWRENAAGDLSFYILLPQDAGFLRTNLIPMSSVDISVILVLILVFVFLISVCMFLWVYPLWRDLKHLVGAASEFGRGNLQSRAEVSKISVVASLGRTFNQMANKIGQLLEGQKVLTNAIAHDLRTPLYRLRFAFEMLDESTTPAQGEQYRLAIVNSIEDLDHVINQTLLLSRYSNKIQLANFDSYNLSALLKQECDSLFQLYPGIQYSLQIAPQCKDRRAHIDKTAIQRAIGNLVTNACRYAQSKVTVSLEYCSESDQFSINVSDDGPGINEADFERIFMPFEQLNDARAESDTGSGLGLAIVSHIARWHGGTVTAGRSESGGAQFVFKWPATPPPDRHTS